MKTITVRIPAIVTADGHWAVNGSDALAKDEPDWGWLDEMCDHDNPTNNPQRLWITVELPVPEPLEISATAAAE